MAVREVPMIAATEPTKPRRIELILRQIDSLPTLPAIATRLLSLTSDDDSHARDVVDLIAADPALTAKVLSLCRTADKGLRDEVITIERAVVLLGFNAIRNAVLSVKVFEAFHHERPDRDAERPSPDGAGRFDRHAFWSHSLAVGILAEQALANGPRLGSLDPGEAFVCGLLHDIGKLALDHVLPKSFARVVELAELNQGNIAEYERRVIGIDHHTAGKRLAEQWGLPHRLQDCIWLHGTPFDTLPKLEHQRLIGLISLADGLARQHHIGYSGNHAPTQNIEPLCEKIGVSTAAVERAVAGLHEHLELRGRALGLHDQPSEALFLDSIQRANQALGRLNQVLERRGRTSAVQQRVLDGIAAFHASNAPAQRVQDVLDAVVESARSVIGHGFFAMLYPTGKGSDAPEAWLMSEYNDDGRPLQSQFIDAPAQAPSLKRLDSSQPLSLDLMAILPWIADYLIHAPDLRRVRLLPLACGWGTAALLLHDREHLPPWNVFQAITSTWGAAIAAAGQHDGARRMGEELAQANSALAEAQDRLLRQESMARLGEMAAGAAHEMNNPLAVISGRSQLLTMTLKPATHEHKAALTIFQNAHRLSDLISSLRMFADPPRAKRQQVHLGALLDETVKRVAGQHLSERDAGMVSLQVRQPLDVVQIDAEMIRSAVTELLVNAIQAKPRSGVQVAAQMQLTLPRVTIQVIDDGEGMDEHTLAHCMDPFFSAKSAGRQVGMGLTRAQQWAAAHGGTVDIRSTPGKGTTATLHLPLDSAM
jgi:putative nucleotidyltransferase with HDIG domain